MQTLYKILVLVFLAAAGFFLVPLVIHVTIWADILNSEAVPQDFLKNMIQKASFVWMGSIVAGIVSLLIQQSWRIVLLLCPLILPSLFTFIYIIMQS